MGQDPKNTPPNKRLAPKKEEPKIEFIRTPNATRAPSPSASPSGQAKSPSQPLMRPSAKEENLGSRRFPYGSWVIAIALIFGVYKFTQRDSVVDPQAAADLVSFDPNAVDPCVVKKYCLQIYVSPWCSSCRASVPFFKQVQERLKDSTQMGVQIIVGQDKEARVREMAKGFGGSVAMDASGAFKRKRNFTAVPTSTVVRTVDRKIMSQVSGGFGQEIPPAFLDQVIAKYLKMETSEIF